jgi:hypothetical protein
MILTIMAIVGFFIGMWFGLASIGSSINGNPVPVVNLILTAAGWTLVFAYFILC